MLSILVLIISACAYDYPVVRFPIWVIAVYETGRVLLNFNVKIKPSMFQSDGIKTLSLKHKSAGSTVEIEIELVR